MEEGEGLGSLASNHGATAYSGAIFGGTECETE